MVECFLATFYAVRVGPRWANLIFDVGMHKGEDTEYYLKKGFNVVAFEANPELIEHCKIRFQDAIARHRLQIIEGAVASASVGTVVTFYTNQTSVWGTVDARWALRNSRLGSKTTGELKVNRIDGYEIFAKFGMPFYLKIDVEGVDKYVLESVKDFVERPQYVSIESEKVNFANLESELELLMQLGYSKFKVVQQDMIPGTTIRTRTLEGRDFEYTFEAHSSGPFGEDIAQPWMTPDETIAAYRRIFTRYRYFGDDSWISKFPNSWRRAICKAYKIGTGYRGPLPGWFDTHASL